MDSAIEPGRRKRPGRKEGHETALRRLAEDRPDGEGAAACRPVCLHCHGELRKLKRHRRVEDIFPADVLVTCYRTRSEYCPPLQQAG